MDIITALKTPHLAISSKYTPNSSNWCFNWLTSWNYLWTSRVKFVSNHDERPFLVSYGHSPVPYHTVEIENNKVKVIGNLGNNTSTEFVKMNISISNKQIPVIKMSYIRYGAQADFILIDEQSVSSVELNFIRNLYSSNPSCHSVCCCFRNTPSLNPV